MKISKAAAATGSAVGNGGGLPSRIRCTITPLQSGEPIEECAHMMADSEPWITLGRGIDECRSVLRNPAFERYAAYSGGTLAGVVVIDMRGVFAGYIGAVCVAPSYRGRGVGSVLVRYAQKRIFRDSPNVFLCVSSFNRDARRFYERLGFERVGVLKDFIVRGHSEILMRKSRGPRDGYHAKRSAGKGENGQKQTPGIERKLKQNWAGGLKRFKKKYSSIELQKKALEWRDI